VLFGIQDAVSYHLDMPFYATTFAWVMNQAKYDSLSEGQRQVMDEHCTSEWAERVATGWADEEDAGREVLLNMEGHEGIVPTEEELAQWREAAEPLRARWIEGVNGAGHDAEAVWAELMSELEARDSAY
jgi:TRAP-type transport system periplasmic protein